VKPQLYIPLVDPDLAELNVIEQLGKRRVDVFLRRTLRDAILRGT
jgi:hypothetical protein